MPTLVLRLYGRFAYAVARDAQNGVTGEITAIAPKFGGEFGPHLPMMSIPRSALVLGEDTIHGGFLTDLPPSIKVISDATDVLDAETFVWKLDGLDVSLVPDSSRGPRPSATLGLADPERVIPDLRTLMAQIGHTKVAFDTSTLSAANVDKVNAVVKVTEGKGTAMMAIESDTAFLIPKRVADENPKPSSSQMAALISTPLNKKPDGSFEPFKKADVVEFEIAVARNVPVTFSLVNPLTNKAHKVSVQARSSGDRIIVSFSNLCSSIPLEETYDLEFFQYYSLLQTDAGADALVLLPGDDGGEPGDCNAKAMIDFQASA